MESAPQRVSPPASASPQRASSSFQDTLLAWAPERSRTSKRPSRQVREVQPWVHISHRFNGAARNHRNSPTQSRDEAMSDSGSSHAAFHPITSMMSEVSTKAAPKKKNAAANKMSEFFHKKLAAYKHNHHGKAARTVKQHSKLGRKRPNPLHEMARHTRELIPVAAARAQRAAHSAALNAAATAVLDKKKQQAALKAATAAAVKAAVASETASVHRVGHAFSDALKTKQSTRVRTLVS